MSDVRPFEEYKEMIKDMRKEEMIKGLYDLSARITEQDKEIERLNNIIKDIETYIHLWNIEEIGEKTMLILNDILLIKNGMRNEVVRLKENKDGER